MHADERLKALMKLDARFDVAASFIEEIAEPIAAYEARSYVKTRRRLTDKIAQVPYK